MLITEETIEINRHMQLASDESINRRYYIYIYIYIYIYTCVCVFEYKYREIRKIDVVI